MLTRPPFYSIDMCHHEEARATMLPRPRVTYQCTPEQTRPWKDHFKSDFRSDQDHLLEKGSLIRLRSYLKKSRSEIKIKDHFLSPKSPF
jgi:hypothetical protein